ncbi:transglycosylase domain-containing protein [Sphaerimonospora mesophila]|uniref:transglycosylase domain-containing protein n=1 Tax=Sphaerimonospora mesophila TaxID=37483 RepID=UPI000AD9CF29
MDSGDSGPMRRGGPRAHDDDRGPLHDTVPMHALRPADQERPEGGSAAGVPPPTRRRRRRLRALLVMMISGFVVLAVAFGVIWLLTPIPDSTKKDATAEGSVIYYRNGKNILAKQGVNRENVPLAQVPKPVREAVIAAENRTFYRDKGVSVSGTARAVWSTLTGRQLQGGSTITQQLVRNYYSGIGQERSISRKLKEIMIALKVDRSKSKDWVLEQYLNTIYFGRGAHGIQAASRAYFDTDVQNLDVAQGAYLAAVIQQPSRFANPEGSDLEAVRARWRSVIDGMVEIGALGRAEAGRQTFPELAEQKPPLATTGQDGYMLAQVRAELNRLGYSDEDINQGGLKITTTFDRRLMRLAREAVKSVLPDDTPKKVRTGLAAVDPATGEVRAFYGGDFAATQYDNAFSAKVQAGSTFKPYTLAAALEAGYGLGTRVYGDSPLKIGSAEIPNAGGRSYGSAITLVEATRGSVNTAFVDLGQKVGLDKVAAAAEAAGIPAEQIAPHAGAATLPLGVASVSAVQQASGFGTFAAGGIHRDAHVIREVTDAAGNTRKFTAPERRAFSENTAADATYALQQVVRGGTGTAAALPDRPVAGKTGTTDESAAVWFAGYVPQLSVAVNMFRDDNKPVRIPGWGELYGGTLPAQIWRTFMTGALEGKPVKEFPPPVTWDPNNFWDAYAMGRNPDRPGVELGYPDPSGAPTPLPSEAGTEDPYGQAGPQDPDDQGQAGQTPGGETPGARTPGGRTPGGTPGGGGGQSTRPGASPAPQPTTNPAGPPDDPPGFEADSPPTQPLAVH